MAVVIKVHELCVEKRGARHVTLTCGIATHDSGQYFSSAPIMSHGTVVRILGWVKSFSHLNGKQEVLGFGMNIYQTKSENVKIVTEAHIPLYAATAAW